MSRRKKQDPKPKPPVSKAQHDQALAEETTEKFTCAWETSSDLAFTCASRLQDLHTDHLYGKLARDIWQTVQEPGAQPLVAILVDFVAEAERHRVALEELARRLAPLVTHDDFHIHLDPKEDYLDLVRQRILGKPA